MRELPDLAEALATALDLAAEPRAPRPRRVKPASSISPPAGPDGQGEGGRGPRGEARGGGSARRMRPRARAAAARRTARARDAYADLAPQGLRTKKTLGFTLFQ